MKSSRLLRKLADLEEEWERVCMKIPDPVYGAMTYEELTCLRDLMREQINQGTGASVEDVPEALAIWKTANARIEQWFDGKQTWPHWRAIWSVGVEEAKSKTESGRSRAVKRVRK